MPDSVVAANPTTVMPFSLAVAFQQSRQYSVDSNFYPDASYQSNPLSSTSRKQWQITKRLTQAQLTTLRTFFRARDGGAHEFWFYDLWETVPIFTYDESGEAVEGRHAVRFAGAWTQVLDVGRNQAKLALIEVA